MAPIPRVRSFSRPWDSPGQPTYTPPHYQQHNFQQQEPYYQQQFQEHRKSSQLPQHIGSPLLTKSAAVQHHNSQLNPKQQFTTVLVGARQRSFKVNKALLCECSPFFRERLEEQTSPNPSAKPISLWLPGESATMFRYFVQWLESRPRFRYYLDDAINLAIETSRTSAKDVHWTLFRLHLFASHLELYGLQDIAMDAIQDLYLKCDWDVNETVVSYLYTKCEALPAVRLRRWAVAMIAFSVTSGADIRSTNDSTASSPSDTDSELTVLDRSAPYQHHLSSRSSYDDMRPNTASRAAAAKPFDDANHPQRFQPLMDILPEFSFDYGIHMRKMRASGLDVRFKNPQLRIPANKLRNDERAFGFRQCSFHSHRASVGEKMCPHDVAARKVVSGLAMLGGADSDRKIWRGSMRYADGAGGNAGRSSRVGADTGKGLSPKGFGHRETAFEPIPEAQIFELEACEVPRPTKGHAASSSVPSTTASSSPSSATTSPGKGCSKESPPVSAPRSSWRSSFRRASLALRRADSGVMPQGPMPVKRTDSVVMPRPLFTDLDGTSSLKGNGSRTSSFRKG